MTTAVEAIKQKALELGFCDCGITDCSPIAPNIVQAFEQRIEQHKTADMYFLSNNMEKRFFPQILVPEAKSIVVVLANYYQKIQYNGKYKIALYAWGEDYHKVVKKKLKLLQQFIVENIDNKSINRYFVDTAPTMDKYLAYRAGLGWIGKNTLLNGKYGSFCFIGILFTSLELEIDQPITTNPCQDCNLCIKACPTKALYQPYSLDANLCWSYQTIENKGNIRIENSKQSYIYGCDICQKVCPHNQHAENTTIKEFQTNSDLSDIDDKRLDSITTESFETLFAHTPIHRIGYEKMKANINIIKKGLQTKDNKK